MPRINTKCITEKRNPNLYLYFLEHNKRNGIKLKKNEISANYQLFLKNKTKEDLMLEACEFNKKLNRTCNFNIGQNLQKNVPHKKDITADTNEINNILRNIFFHIKSQYKSDDQFFIAPLQKCQFFAAKVLISIEKFCAIDYLNSYLKENRHRMSYMLKPQHYATDEDAGQNKEIKDMTRLFRRFLPDDSILKIWGNNVDDIIPSYIICLDVYTFHTARYELDIHNPNTLQVIQKFWDINPDIITNEIFQTQLGQEAILTILYLISSLYKIKLTEEENIAESDYNQRLYQNFGIKHKF